MSQLIMPDYIAAGNPETPLAVLEQLAHAVDARIRRRVAESEYCSLELLQALAEDPSAEVRSAVGHNPRSPKLLVDKLSSDENADVRYSMATHPGLDRSVLERLISDENPYVSARACKTERRLVQESSVRQSSARRDYFVLPTQQRKDSHRS